MESLRNIPAIDEILMNEQIKVLTLKYNRQFIVTAVRQAVDQVRYELRMDPQEVNKDNLLARIIHLVEEKISTSQGTLYKVINGTGVVLHTNLGRAPLGNRALEYINKTARDYNNLEMNLTEGIRGSRYDHVENLLIELTGAEAALVVNNNAAAVMLGLNTFAFNKEVIVSRGQLVEIGGSFRIPEVMKLSGAKLIEVGTTNKTYASDYENAINENTGMLFTAHTSNYKIVGFTASVSNEEIVELGKKYSLPVMQDLGSGIIVDLQHCGLTEEPLVQESITAGIDIMSFSGDKLLGGPQAGILVGKKKYIDAMKKNQLTRALRVDKLTIAALEGTLLEYLSGNPMEQIPIIRMLSRRTEELKDEAESLAHKITFNTANWDELKDIAVIPTEDMVGGGAYPTLKIPGYGVQLEFREGALEIIAKCLRQKRPALLARRQDNKMLLSVRTLMTGDDELIVRALLELINQESTPGGQL
ncbi:MAG TPA: L-seryl-tRNA(Sec) selenium transferase [Syntrophomonadaceae bacterium]|nr:L-seryl-tRNA(Sec) selenium transferase [Syntrophomonadaceae bacterium]HRX20799.1 L-seryl-tRNA(Sec) selenium transferase [Syntrophomonadaceae bacterium]